MTTISGGLAGWYERATSPMAGGVVEPLPQRVMGKGLRAWFGELNATSAQPRDGAARAKGMGRFLHAALFLRVAHDLVVRGGILAGVAGVRQSLVLAMQAYWGQLKIAERERNWRQKNEDVVMRMLAETPETAAKAAARAYQARREAQARAKVA